MQPSPRHPATSMSTSTRESFAVDINFVQVPPPPGLSHHVDSYTAKIFATGLAVATTGVRQEEVYNDCQHSQSVGPWWVDDRPLHSQRLDFMYRLIICLPLELPHYH